MSACASLRTLLLRPGKLTWRWWRESIIHASPHNGQGSAYASSFGATGLRVSPYVPIGASARQAALSWHWHEKKRVNPINIWYCITLWCLYNTENFIDIENDKDFSWRWLSWSFGDFFRRFLYKRPFRGHNFTQIIIENEVLRHGNRFEFF